MSCRSSRQDDGHPTSTSRRLPINGLRIRPLLNRKVVMDAQDAAGVTHLVHPAIEPWNAAEQT
jgi:hypothetical protein